MTEFISTSYRLSITMDGKAEITLQTDKDALPCLETLPDGELLVSIKKKPKKRTLTQNAYLWKLLGDIGAKLSIPREEVYRSYVRDYGPSDLVTLSKAAAPRFKREWEAKGKGWICDMVSSDENSVDLLAIYGSSSYDTKEMSAVLEAVIKDCEEMGIPTLLDWRALPH